MLTNLKALLVILPVAFAVFSFLRPLCLKFMAEADFLRRRNLWFALTGVAFLSPSFWLFALIAIPLVASAAAKDKNPVALYLVLLQVIPPFGLQLPVVGINQLFELNSYRILAFALLIPALFRLSRERSVRKTRRDAPPPACGSSVRRAAEARDQAGCGDAVHPLSAAAQEIAGLQSSVRSLERTKAEHEETILMLQRLNSELQTHVHELSGNDDPNTAKLARQYDARVWARPELAATVT